MEDMRRAEAMTTNEKLIVHWVLLFTCKTPVELLKQEELTVKTAKNAAN